MSGDGEMARRGDGEAAVVARVTRHVAEQEARVRVATIGAERIERGVEAIEAELLAAGDVAPGVDLRDAGQSRRDR